MKEFRCMCVKRSYTGIHCYAWEYTFHLQVNLPGHNRYSNGELVLSYDHEGKPKFEPGEEYSLQECLS